METKKNLDDKVIVRTVAAAFAVTPRFVRYVRDGMRSHRAILKQYKTLKKKMDKILGQ